MPAPLGLCARLYGALESSAGKSYGLNQRVQIKLAGKKIVKKASKPKITTGAELHAHSTQVGAH